MAQMTAPPITALAAADQRRSAKKTLAEIDALLRDEDAVLQPRLDPSTSKQHHCGSVAPGPGAYDPNHRSIRKACHCVTVMDRSPQELRRRQRERQVQQRRRCRQQPGPGAYAVEDADHWTKPRAPAQRFCTSRCCRFWPDCGCRDAAAASTSVVEDDDNQGNPRGACGMVLPSRATNVNLVFRSKTKFTYRTHEQRQRVQSIRRMRRSASRACVGYYAINYSMTEPRSATKGLVAMASHATMKQSTKQRKANLARKLQVWQGGASQKNSADDEEQDREERPTITRFGVEWSKGAKRMQHRATKQWLRARSVQLLRLQQLRVDHQKASDARANEAAGTTAVTGHGALDMKKQRGRDIVWCPRKCLRVITAFDEPARKHGRKSERRLSSNPRTNAGHSLVPFDKTLGRQEALSQDNRGLFLLTMAGDDGGRQALDLVPDDSVMRERVRAARFDLETNTERFPFVSKLHDQRMPLEPRMAVVKPSVRVTRMDRQTNRPPFVPVPDSTREELIVEPDWRIYDRLKFASTPAVVQYARMAGRSDTTRDQSEKMDLTPNWEVRMPKSVCLIDMDKDKLVRLANPEKDPVLCVLRANHDELEHALQLLSKCSRLRTGAVDMSKGTERFQEPHRVSAPSVSAISSPANLNVLSTKGSNDKRTLVNMATALPRWTNDKKDEMMELNPQDEGTSKRHRAVVLSDFRTQRGREENFLRPERDSLTTRFLLQKHCIVKFG